MSDLADGGASEFAKIQDQLQAALIQLHGDYPGYQIFAVGHSLGGGMAQAFGLRNDLDAAVYNSLPIPKGTIDSGYFGDEGFSGRVNDFVASGRVIHDVYTANDIATLWYRNTATVYGTYLSGVVDGQDAVMLPGREMPSMLRLAMVAGSVYTAVPAIGISAADHLMGSLADAAQGLGTDPATGRFVIPEGSAVFSDIPASVRSQLGALGSKLSDSPLVKVDLAASSEWADSYVIKRQDGSIQTVDIYKSSGQVEINQTVGATTYRLQMNKLDPHSVRLERIDNNAVTASVDVQGSSSAVAQTIGAQRVEVGYQNGNASANTLRGGSGNDTLDGGKGADIMVGGIGDDVYFVDDVGDVVSEAVGEGSDTVLSSISLALSANVENLTLCGGALNASGNAAANVLTGNALGNVLDGGAGADTMIGAGGDDVYVVDSLGDRVVEFAGEGADTIRSSLSLTLVANVENLILTGVATIDATGNDNDNRLIGNVAANVLTGAAGSDTLDGGVGADTMIGGVGNDTYVVDQAGDLIVEYAGEGNDTVMASVSLTLGANLENLVMTGSAAISGVGNGLDNRLVGNCAANRLQGCGGNDTLEGGGGDDVLTGGSGSDLVYGGDGDDVIDGASGNDFLAGGGRQRSDLRWCRR